MIKMHQTLYIVHWRFEMKKVFVCSLIMLLCGACATVIDGNVQQLAFDSNEKDVEIYINNNFSCKTPCLTNVKRANKKLMVVAKKEGFQDRTVFLNKNMNSSTAFNVLSLWTSTFGFSTDLTTEDVWEYQPNSVYVVMTKEPKTAAEHQRVQKQNQIRDFVLRNFDALQSESDNLEGTGEYIQALSKMSNIAPIEIKSVLSNTYIATDCAERIVGLMISK